MSSTLPKRKYPVGIQDLSEVITGGYTYVDKTHYVYKLIDEGKFYFLSRPRRFGKSLFVTTMEYLFKAKKEIFEGLYIYDKWDWSKTSPIIKIGFSSISHTEKGLYKAIEDTLMDIAKSYELTLEESTIGSKFRELIEKLCAKYGKVVVLIDEYDKPIIDYIEKNTAKALENRDILKSFYSILKDADPHLKLVFITGVSKFSRVSRATVRIFSDLNNLNDITLDENYSGICGITQSELEQNFSQELEAYGADKIKQWYNGYHWKGKESVYNPFSLVNFFVKNGDFQNYWFISGTPTFLMNLAKKERLYDFESTELIQAQLDAYDIEHLQLTSLMFQTGYLTIKNYDSQSRIYELGYPNEEVRQSYIEFLAKAYSDNYSQSVQVLALQMHRALRELNFDKVQSIFNTIFKSIPYEIWQKENEPGGVPHYYHALIHLTFRLLDIYVTSQVQTADGRADAIVILDAADGRPYVFAFEFKLGSSAEKALQQVKDKGYLVPYFHQGRQCIGIGLNFSKEDKKVEQLLWEVIE